MALAKDHDNNNTDSIKDQKAKPHTTYRNGGHDKNNIDTTHRNGGHRNGGYRNGYKTKNGNKDGTYGYDSLSIQLSIPIQMLVTGFMRLITNTQLLDHDIMIMIAAYSHDMMNVEYNQRNRTIYICPKITPWQLLKDAILKLFNLEFYCQVVKLEYKLDKSSNSACIDSEDIWDKLRISYDSASECIFQVTTKDLPHIERIDNALSRYYKSLNKSYDNIFKNYCEDYGITEEMEVGETEPDNGHILFELFASPQDSLCAEYDEDFPFADDKERDEDQRFEFIMNLLQKCYKNPAIEFQEKTGDNLVATESALIHPGPTLSQLTLKKEAEKLMTEHCHSVFTSQLKHGAKDQAFLNVKAIDIKYSRPYLLFYMDAYARLRMHKYYSFEQQLTTDNDEETPQSIDGWGIPEFCKKHKDQIEDQIETSQFIVDQKPITVQELEDGLKSFRHRIMGTMKLYQPLWLICDDLNDFGKYLLGIGKYITDHAQAKPIEYVHPRTRKNQPIYPSEEKEETPQQIPTYTVPCQVDIMIIPQCTKENTKDESGDPGSDDDDDIDDTKDDPQYLWMGFGGKDGSKVGNKPVYEINDIGQYLKQCGYIENKDYIKEDVKSDHSHGTNDFKQQIDKIKKQCLNMHNKMNRQRLTHQRLIFIIDRRNPKILRNQDLVYPNYTLTNKDWQDKIYCIAPKKVINGRRSKSDVSKRNNRKEERQEMPHEFMRLPESLFNMSHELLLPPNPSYKHNEPIGIRQALNGYMFTLSFHIYNPTAIRVYFGYGGVVQRFKLEDAQKFWPSLFIAPGNTKQRMKIDITKYGLKEFPDPDFKQFQDRLSDPSY